MGSYSRGRYLEYKARDRLTSVGYTVCRSAGSKGVDLIAMRPDGDLLVSCRKEFQLDPADWNTLYDLAITLGKTPILAVASAARSAGGVIFYRLTARKTGRRGVRSPCEPYTPLATDAR